MSGSTKPRIHVTQENASWFDECADEWQRLLAASRADRLFMSWEWQNGWWRHFALPAGGQLVPLTARDQDGRLLGIAPLFRREERRRRLVPAHQLAPIGNVWRTGVGEVTEHLDWIIDRQHEAAVTAAFVDALAARQDWHEFLCAYARVDGPMAQGLAPLARQLDCYTRSDGTQPYYTIDTRLSFEAYLEGLSHTARRQLHGRRRLSMDSANLVFRETTAENLDLQLEKLGKLSLKRWATDLEPAFRAFYRELSARWLAANRLRFSILEFDGQPVSAQLDVIAESRRYNLRSAFDEGFDRKLSPGLLHIGYAIESACSDAEIEAYELLAGGGKHTDFKYRFAQHQGDFVSLQLIRRRHEKVAFMLYDTLRGRAR